MANNISFRGEINEMSAAYFIREMETLPARSAATIYLHTPGGDVYAGGEMVNAMRAAVKRGCKFEIEIGSLCASMGASLLAAARAAGCRAIAHSNTEVMFHGCWTIMVGGADELTDQAKAMRDFNECVKRDLAKCGITDTDEWFAADRQKWLNADELLALGLVDSICEDASDDPEDLKDAAVKIAAKLNHKETQMNEITIKAEEPKTEPVETPAAAAETPAETPAVETPAPAAETPAEETAEAAPAPADDVETRAAALAEERFRGLQAKQTKMISDITNTRDLALKDLEAAKAESTSLKAEIEKLTADLAALRDQLAESERNRESIVVDALAPAAELPTLAEGLANCKTLQERADFIRNGNYKH